MPEGKVGGRKATKKVQRRKKNADASDDFFVNVAGELRKVAEESNVLLSIPIWGWPGNGKTCSLLTAIQYCELSQHGVALARVKDTEELSELEESRPQYRGLGLSGVAEATATRLVELNQLFFADLEYPEGTDDAMHYLLEVRATKGKLGWVLFPDIMGGAYEKLDQVAKNATSNAHAMILLVDPVEYQAGTTQAKEYRDDIAGVIQRCAKDGVPTSVMITKDDVVDEKIVDETHTSLVAMLGAQSDFRYKLHRVSVVGDIDGDWSSAPPALTERKPTRLLQGFAWALAEALKKPRDWVLNRVPRTNLKNLSTKQAAVPAKEIAELRVVRDQTGSPGTVLCALPGTSRFLVLDAPTKEMTEVSVDHESGEGQVGASVEVEDWDDSEVPCAHATPGAVFLSGDAGDVIWYGAKGQSLTRMSLPYPMASWVPADDRVLIGVGENGTLHTLALSGGKWTGKDYKAEFVGDASNVVCGYLRNQSLVVAHSGADVAAIKLEAGGTLGAVSQVSLPVRFDTNCAEVANSGFVAGIKSDRSLVAGLAKEHNLGPTLPDAPIPFALADDAGVVAWLSKDRRLRAGVISPDGAEMTAPEHSPLMQEEVPSGMCWNSEGTVLLLTFPSGRWASVKRFGFAGGV